MTYLGLAYVNLGTVENNYSTYYRISLVKYLKHSRNYTHILLLTSLTQCNISLSRYLVYLESLLEVNTEKMVNK